MLRPALYFMLCCHALPQFPSADVLTSSDQLSATTTDGGLERWPDAGAAANIGIMLFR